MFHVGKKEILTFATTQMDLQCIMLSDVSQAGKDKHYDLTPV